MKVTFALLTLALVMRVAARPDGTTTDPTMALEAPVTVVEATSGKSHASQYRVVHLARRHNFDPYAIALQDIKKEFQYYYNIMGWAGVMSVVYNRYWDAIAKTQTSAQMAVFNYVTNGKLTVDRDVETFASSAQSLVRTALEQCRNISNDATGRSFFVGCLGLVNDPSWQNEEPEWQ
ncbi:hypothetical protein H4R35_001486 [Dimargaris xerosporica]|nr:hypothetical protein H4R35_001486 [Dimargaris xerosporica]